MVRIESVVRAGRKRHNHRSPVAVAHQPEAHLIPAAHGTARRNAGAVGHRRLASRAARTGQGRALCTRVDYIHQHATQITPSEEWRREMSFLKSECDALSKYEPKLALRVQQCSTMPYSSHTAC